jgi:LmbE family N-acetylglucosaminyl deacetylase
VKDTNVLVVAPHCDDEVLGVGGTMARWAEEGARVTVAILTRGFPPLATEEDNAKELVEIARAHELLGVHETVHLGFPAAELDQVPHRELNGALLHLYQRLKPEFVFLPWLGDVHLDHQLAFQSGMVMCRPNGGHVPRNVLAYETLSETNWYAPLVTPGFVPNTFVDISNHLERKLEAFAAYGSQVRQAPNERSIETLRALATLRGSTVHRPAAEAFISVRALI